MCDTKNLAVGQQTGDSSRTPTTGEDQAQAPPRGFRRHLDGWQLGLLALAAACCAGWLALPRPVEPTLVPTPEVDRRALSRTLAADRSRAERAAMEPLPFEVRALGELVRGYGLESDAARGREVRADAARSALALIARSGAAPLLTLRALQTELFLAAAARWQASGRVDRDLRELSGNFPEKCKNSGWVDPSGRLVLTEAEQRVLFKVRWCDITGTLEQRDLRPTLDEFRVYYRVLLEHPAGASAFERDERRLSAVRELARIDDAFPVALASGVLAYRLGQVDVAQGDFRAHLAAHPDGPWALRARNYAVFMAALLPPEE